MRGLTVTLSIFIVFSASVFSFVMADRMHQVYYGDTLWDLSIRYYNTPFHWEDILEANESLEGIELLRPGTELIIPDIYGTTVSTSVVNTSIDIYTASLTSSGSLLSRLLLETTGMVTFDPPAPVCYVVEINVDEVDEYASEFAIPGDMIALDIGQNQGVEIGRVYKIYNIGEEVRHPETGEKLGEVIRVAGVCRVIRTSPTASVALLEHCYLPVIVGDYLVPYTSIAPVEVSSNGVVSGMDAWVIAFQDPDTDKAYAFDIVFLDRGSEDGLQAGDIFNMYKYGQLFDSPSGSTVVTPNIPISRLIILSTTLENSAAIIFSSSSIDLIEIGDRIELAREQQ
ncbi:MAG: LysM peptidoglycan-binding domain-containing protein [Candidatus Aegiribacteria sp.]|nr:LysM peptidoglycan-binding domain-containing protein [Candidatus Aegiribacteria sp.]